MTLSGLLLGLVNVGIVAAILILVGAIAVWILTACNFPPPENVRKAFMLVVGLVVLYMIIALIFGLPTWQPLALPFR